MDINKAKTAIKSRTLVGISNVDANSCYYLFSTGYLVGEIKHRDRILFVFTDRWKEMSVMRPASEFVFV